MQSDIAKKLLKQKVENINKVKPDFISTGNIGCIMQITNGTKIPILHTVEVIDWYTGGPKPKSLSSLWKKIQREYWWWDKFFNGKFGKPRSIQF